MDNLLQLAMQMILCLVIAAIIGAIIGYLLGKMSKCGNNTNEINEHNSVRKKELHDYEQKALPQKESNETKNYIASVANSTEDTSKLHNKTLSETIQNELHIKDKKKTNDSQGTLKHVDSIEGHRPELLSSSRHGNADDLKEISGIGLKIEEALNELGIFHFDQIASWTNDNAKWIDNYLVFKGRVIREDWIGQAKLLAAGGSTEFSRKIKKGDKYK